MRSYRTATVEINQLENHCMSNEGLYTIQVPIFLGPNRINIIEDGIVCVQFGRYNRIEKFPEHSRAYESYICCI